MDLPVQGKVKPDPQEEDPESLAMKIGELAAASGTTTKTLRFYEDQGLLPEAARTPAGYRDYDPETINRIDFVHRGQAAGLTLTQIRQILDIRDRGDAPCGHVRDVLDQRLADVDTQLARLHELRDTLLQLRGEAADLAPETCSPDQVCRYL